MITVKSNNYTTVQLRALSEILHIWLVELMSNHCSASCEECVYAYVCNDVESTLKFLDKKIKENRDKLMENSKAEFTVCSQFIYNLSLSISSII